MGPIPGDVLNDRARALAREARRAAAMVASGEPEGVHDLRVVLRRSRNLLRSFRSMLPEEQRAEAARLAAECRWAGAELGPVRDAEVVHRRLAALLQGQPADLVRGDAAAVLADRARGDLSRGRARVAGLGEDPRFGRLLDDLQVLAAGEPFSPGDEDAVRHRLRREWRRLRRRARAADALPAGGPEAEAALHETRKAAKRTRYAAEALEPLLEEAGRAAALAEQVQDALGAHRDTLLTRALLGELAERARLEGDDALALDRLHALEEARGDAAIAAYRDLRGALETGT